MAILINIDAVRTTAEQIDVANKTMRDDLAAVDTVIRTLQQSWQGEGSAACTGKYDYIKRTYPDVRYQVVNNMVTFLKNQVGDSYDQAERKISSAASAFK
jgi:uncharacterized protein YukE